jgi:hypothetical protein
MMKKCRHALRNIGWHGTPEGNATVGRDMAGQKMRHGEADDA